MINAVEVLGEERARNKSDQVWSLYELVYKLKEVLLKA